MTIQQAEDQPLSAAAQGCFASSSTPDRRWVCLASAVGLWLSAELGQCEEARAPVALAHLKVIDVEGQVHRFAESSRCNGVVVTFLSTTCPISNAALPALETLSTRYQKQGIEFYGVISSPHANCTDAADHAKAFAIHFPVLFDASGELRRELKPTHTPQVFVLAPTGEILYSGRIDDQFPTVGRKRLTATEQPLANALRDIIEGRRVRVPQTRPVGCLQEATPAATDLSVTYHRDIAPIVLSSCAGCHRAGESAPFPLQSYADVQSHARQIAEVTHSRLMPPWHPEDNFGRFQDDRRLSEAEIQLIGRWVTAGCPEGNAKESPPQPEFPTGWQLGEPDLVLEMKSEFIVPANGGDVHQHFVVPTNLRGNRMVAAVEFRPGNPRAVHHASFYVDTSGAAKELESNQPDIGYGSFSGPGFDCFGTLRSWLPGMAPARLPHGMGTELPARSDVVMEIHYRPSGKIEKDQSRLGIYFAEPGAKQRVVELQVMNKDLVIPAGEAKFRHRASFTLPVAIKLLDAAPHMHQLGQEMKATAKLPDGEVVPLIWIRNWDANWQGQYLYVDPVRLPAGTVIEVEAGYDNSAGNVLNPHSPPQTVTWGERSVDEMAICHFRYTCDSPQELRQMQMTCRGYLNDQQERYRKVIAQWGPR